MVILPSEGEIVNLIMSLQLNPILIYNGGDKECEKMVEKIKIKLEGKRE